MYRRLSVQRYTERETQLDARGSDIVRGRLAASCFVVAVPPRRLGRHGRFVPRCSPLSEDACHHNPPRGAGRPALRSLHHAYAGGRAFEAPKWGGGNDDVLLATLMIHGIVTRWPK